MGKEVSKLPYSIEASEMEFDITKPQPQLFVTPDFPHLSFVLEEFANKMALRRGGLKGVKKLIESNALGTVELSTGIQVSGKFIEVLSDEYDRPVYIRTAGPTALAYKNKEVIGHHKEYHRDGFGSPVGKLKGINLPIEDMSPTDLEAYGIYEGRETRLNFEGGIEVKGEIITGKRNLQGKIILISFKNCLVRQGDRILFHPDWGIYDMAVGASLVSAFSGIADPNSYGLEFEVPAEKTHKIRYSDSDKALFALYGEVRAMRSEENCEVSRLGEILELLLPLEIYELSAKTGESALSNRVRAHLDVLAKHEKTGHLVRDGLKLIH
jgi:phenylalanine-4-hydroxylase